MGQPGMRITVDAAMRARDGSRPRPAGEEPSPASGSGPAPGGGGGPADQGKRSESTRRTKAAKNERRRMGKRGAVRRPPADGG